MPSPRKIVFLLLILVSFLSLGGIIAGYFLLPTIIEDKVREKVLQNTPITDFGLAVVKAGFNGMRIADIDAGSEGKKILSAGTVDINFSVRGLFKRKIKRIDIEELTVYLELADGQLSLTGLQSLKSTGEKEPALKDIALPVDLQELRIKNSLLQIAVDGEQVLVPIYLTVKQKKNNRTSYEMLLQLYPGPEQVSLGVDFDLSRNQGNLTVSSQGLPLDRLAPFTGKIPGMEISGRATLNGTSEIRLQPAEALSANIAIGLQPFAFAFDRFKVQTASETAKEMPIKLAFDYLPGNIRYQADNITLAAPAAARLDTGGSLELSKEQLTGAGKLSVAFQELPSLNIIDSQHFLADVSYGYERSTGNWHFNLAKSSSAPAKKIKAQLQDALLVITNPDYKISGKGVDASGEVSLSVKLPEISIAQNELQGSGKLELEGNINYDAAGLHGEMLVELQGGRLNFTKDKYVVEDIKLSAYLPSLPQVRTAASQTFSFSKASIGELIFSDSTISWQLESEDSLYIEDAHIKWAGGNLRTEDVRLALGKDEQFVKIVCEELDLIKVLQQFGIKNAEGKGTISGNIPVYLGKKKIKFENGLLSSEEGMDGRLKIGAFDLLSAGIPRNTPQFVQVDFAAEALKNFNYNWVKLYLNTEGEDLVMQMQMHGTPVKSLPFTYDSRTGLLQRDDTTRQGIHQPIRLDVNFRFPLNRFLGYSGRIMDIMDKIR